VWATGSAWANPLLVCAMAGAVMWVPLGLQPARGSAEPGGAGPVSQVADCLMLSSEQERASCFAGIGTRSGAIPEPVARCLAVPAGPDRGACFAAMGTANATIPAAVARCLAMQAGPKRGACFAALGGRDGVIGARVVRCLKRPAGPKRTSCVRRATR
jgi:hypothetical protein